MNKTFATAGSQAPKKGFSRDSVVSEVTRLSIVMMKSIKKKVQGYAIFGTTDHWTSRDGRAWEGNAFQWIDKDFTLQHVEAELALYTGSTESRILHNNYTTRLREIWGFELGRCQYAVDPEITIVGQVTTDTEAKMNRFGQLLEEKNNVDHSYCTDHSVNSTAIIAYDHKLYANSREKNEKEQTIQLTGGSVFNVGKGLLGKIRKLVHFISASPQANGELKKAQSELADLNNDYQVPKYKDVKAKTVIQDVVTRWWSTYDMVERIVYLREAIEKMDRDGNLKASNDKKNAPSRKPTNEEWELLENVAFLLAPFKDAQLMLKSVKTVTSSLVLYLMKLIHTELENLLAQGFVEDEEDVEEEMFPGMTQSLKELVEAMLKDFHARWGDLSKPFNRELQRGIRQRQIGIHPAFTLAHALDPRFKI